jgi:tetratricopeptide (TPR) repeat protein
VREELTELQLQLVFCAQADADSQKIRDEIIPQLMQSENIKVTRQGIVEMEEDRMEDILHPDAAEQRMERMEENMRKMADMQKQGSDIYFAGFSQMKRFPFFNDVASWFVPFYTHHPGVWRVWSNAKAQKFLRLITQVGAFCDSDKYSFVLAFDQVVSRLPQQMLEMVERGEATPMPVGGLVAMEEQQKPDFQRRVYLQNLFRFFRLFPYRSEFVSPFGPKPCIFFANSLFRGTALEQQMVGVASFLAKRKEFGAAMKVLENMESGGQDYQYQVLKGYLLTHRPEAGEQDAAQAAECYAQALRLQPGDERAMKGRARALMTCGQYAEALVIYEELLALPKASRSIELNTAVCLVNLKRYDEALRQLYKLNYELPDEPQANRVLAWTLTVTGKYAQAQKLYDQLLNTEKPQSGDLLNYGYCLWFQGDIAGTVATFRRYRESQQDTAIDREMLHTEYALIREHGISDTEIHLMLDAIGE